MVSTRSRPRARPITRSLAKVNKIPLAAVSDASTRFKHRKRKKASHLCVAASDAAGVSSKSPLISQPLQTRGDEIELCAACVKLFPRESGHTVKITRLECPSCPGFVGILKTLAPAARSFDLVVYLSWSHEADYELFTLSGFFRDTRLSYFVLPVSVLQSESECYPEFLRRMYDPRLLSSDLIRRWLEQCDEGHGAQCRSPVTPRPSHRLLLIDVVNDCIVDSLGDSQYAALSYVWGSSPTFRTMRADVDQLRHPGSLSTKVIPETIRDAILLTASLRIPYLWVDSICIVQDDNNLRNVHLNSMASIYANSYVTIIAAEGEAASHGIPGVPYGKIPRYLPSCSFRTAEGAEYLLKSTSDCWPDSSKWNSRGWTYQESLLSTRVLLLNGKASWYCSCSHWQEDTGLAPVQWVFRQPPSPQKPRLSLESMLSPLGKWAELVEDYNTRHLTRDEDVLAGFAGITAVMKQYLMEGFFFGIPVGHLHVGLLWRSSGLELFRRKAYATGCRVNTIPSWSWVGWQGHLNLQRWECPEGDRINYDPLQVPGSPIISRSTSDCCEDMTECPHLSLTTTTCVLPLDDFTRSIDGARLIRGTETLAYLFWPEDPKATALLRDLDDIDSDSKDAKIELMALSTGHYTLQYLTRYFHHFTFSRAVTAEMYNVLWIERDQDTACRRALGLVCRDVWESWDLRHEAIKLG